MDLPNRIAEIMANAKKSFELHASWSQFYHDIFGVDGLIRQTLTPAERTAFLLTPEYAEILALCNELHDRHERSDCDGKVITLRLPKALWKALKQEAAESHVSMNKYCVKRLMQP